MNAFRLVVPLAAALVFVCRVQAVDAPARREWIVDGVTREALVYVPPTAKTAATPVIFAFHGHGGTMAYAERKFSYHTLWPEALVVYPQGLPTAGKLTDPEGKKAGWQFAAGDYGDRDLKFFDAMLIGLRKEYRVDDQRIFVTGHSNGGGFTYLLWANRGDQLAAVAPCAAASLSPIGQFKPKPVFHLAGEKDPIVKFEWQKMTMDSVRKINQCGEGQPWGDHCTIYPSKIGDPLVTYIHPGGHEVPPDAPAVIVKFFKEQTAH
ncbi:MAG: esterase [Chthoniobacter sp.]|uniref:alpha/beta hydrolase family esterase n=1 Tax=Chthoniobacter sp. TaxID=2510640 RepID=UPI0032AD0730